MLMNYLSTVKPTITIIALTLLSMHTCQFMPHVPQSPSDYLALDAVVEKIGKAPGVGVDFTRCTSLQKYRVISVCQGEYDQREIIVDHLILSGDELDNFRPGDRVRWSSKNQIRFLTVSTKRAFGTPATRLRPFTSDGPRDSYPQTPGSANHIQ